MNAKHRKSDNPKPLGDQVSGDDNLEIDTLVTLIINRSRLFPAIESQRNADGKVTEVLLSFEIDNLKLVVSRFPEEKRVSGSCLSLSPREMEIAKMVARGYPNKTIAAELDISHWTVGTHIRRIFDKAGVASRAEMVAKLMENGVMSPRTIKAKE
jgi:DNA-binding CsgD family transcriptional regulator